MRVVDVIASALPAGRVVTAEADRRAHAHDYWALEAIHDLGGTPADPPPAVVYPESTSEVATVLDIAQQHRAPIVPFGLGSGVCGGVRPGRDALVVDLSRMNRMVEVRPETLIAVAQAGMNGGEFERRLGDHGLTLGHFPQSIDRSTVGGWVATRASGQLSTRYGNIEDLVLSLEVVLPGGRVVRTFPSPRASTGPDLRALFLGSEGTLGIVTEVGLKVSPRASRQEGFAATLASWEEGLEISREILQAGWRPAVLRLYDGIEAARNFGEWVPDPAPLLLVMNEGTDVMGEALALELAALRASCERRGARILGDAPLRHWLGHRNRVPSWESLLASGLVVDTIEVAATWDRVGPLYGAVTEAIRAVPGILAASGHTSHGYTTGVNIYFTFAGASKEAREQERIYLDAWRAAMEATVACGATVSHHHGIGRVRREWLARELGDEAVATLRSVKQALDPHGIMNPGVLL